MFFFRCRLSGLVKSLLQTAMEVLQCHLRFFEAEVATPDKRLDVLHADVTKCLDPLVHEGLGVTGVIPLVVTVASVTHHVDDDVLVELLAILERESSHADTCFGVIPVDMEDRGLDGLCDIGGVVG